MIADVNMKTRTRTAAYEAGYAAGLYDLDPSDKALTEARRQRLAELYAANGRRFAELPEGAMPREQAIAAVFLKGYDDGAKDNDSPIRILGKGMRKTDFAFTQARRLQLDHC